jgi:N-acyl homoserine lactone hydrolase
MKKYSILFIVLISVFACKKDAKNTEGVVAEEVSKPEISLYILDGGNIKANNLNLFAQGDTYKGESKLLANAYYVINHPKGKLLWDTGLPEGIVGKQPFTTPDGAFTISRPDSLKNQFSKLKITPGDITHIAFSHVHFDHTGAANAFTNAKWIVQKSEMDFINSPEIKNNAFYDVNSFASLKNKEIINGDYDVFGDGSVVIKSMPGHTAGHQVLFLDLPNEGPVVLSGDIYHFRENRSSGIVPQFNYNISQSSKSIADFEEFVESKNAKVIIQHDLNDFNTYNRRMY